MLSALKRFFHWILVAALALLFIDFAVVNRQVVDVSLFPLPYFASLPLFLLIIIVLMLGVALGGLAVNLKLIKTRGQFKAEHKRVMALENEVSVLHTQMQEEPPVLSLT